MSALGVRRDKATQTGLGILVGFVAVAEWYYVRDLEFGQSPT
jgi:hypothetical protein